MDLTTYLLSLPSFELPALYNSQWTCLAVLRTLPDLAKQYLFRLLYMDVGGSKGSSAEHGSMALPEAVLRSWVKPDYVSKHHATVHQLQRLQVLVCLVDANGDATYQLNAAFARNLRAALSQGSMLCNVKLPATVVSAVPPTAELAEYAQEQWESMLRALLQYRHNVSGRGTASRSVLPGQQPLNIPQLLASSGLVDRADITPKGYDFLFSDKYAQLWLLLKQYMADAQQRSGKDLCDVISFLLQLSFRSAGHVIEADSLLDAERQTAAHMAQLGLLYPFKVSHGKWWLSPTPLASCLTQGGDSLAASRSQGFIIVETNFRVCAYTSSPIQAAILDLFVHTECVLPNLVVGTITNRSVTAAISRGIAAEKINTYLVQHAHPNVLKNVPAVPATVMDQIRLWQAEVDRVVSHDAVLYENFDSKVMYEETLKYAQQMCYALWHNDAHMLLVCSAAGHDDIRQVIKSLRGKT